MIILPTYTENIGFLFVAHYCSSINMINRLFCLLVDVLLRKLSHRLVFYLVLAFCKMSRDTIDTSTLKSLFDPSSQVLAEFSPLTLPELTFSETKATFTTIVRHFSKLVGCNTTSIPLAPKHATLNRQCRHCKISVDRCRNLVER